MPMLSQMHASALTTIDGEQANWTLEVEVARTVNFTRVLNAALGPAKFNRSEEQFKRLPLNTLYSNQTLRGGNKNSISIPVLLQATSQVCPALSCPLRGPGPQHSICSSQPQHLTKQM